MPLAAGDRLGAYEILRPLGAGGMGEVYRARDTKLGRDVALKILPASVVDDPDRVARFKREAQLLAALNHPHIAAIYGFDADGATQFLVMELVDGETLADRLKRGPIPVDEVIVVARQIAEALAAAHEKGIIHRDLKPDNVALSGTDQVKVLDFGLAKLAASPAVAGASSLSMSPTLTTPAHLRQGYGGQAMVTGVGMILGTAAYMAPEQAKGRDADKRCDVWAFGCVLYEMLTATRAFAGEDITDTIAAIMRGEPDWSALPPGTPANVRTVLEGCLKKDRRQRIADIAVAQYLLNAPPAAAPIGADVSMPPPAATRSWGLAAIALVVGATLAAAAIVMLWSPWRAEKPIDRPLVRLDVDLGAEVSLADSTSLGSTVAISPDGTWLLYASGTPTNLIIRRLDQLKATELPGTQGATDPSFSPDGQWVMFTSGAKVNKISVNGGAAVPVGDGANSRASWAEDGSIFLIRGTKILRLPAGGGPLETIAESRNGELNLFHPQLLPGGNAVLLAADNPGSVDKTTIEVVTLADRQRKTVLRGGASPRYLATTNATGHLVYVNGATLLAIPFDLKTLTTRRTAVPVVDDVAHENLIGIGQFDVSLTGTLVYRRAVGGSSMLTVQWVDAAGTREPLLARPSFYSDLSVSPDGARVALTITDGGGQDVWVYDPRRDAMTRLTFGGAICRFPRWSPDGRYVVFSSAGNGIVQARADGANQPQALTQSKTLQYPASFTPDGKRLAFEEPTGNDQNQIWTVPVQDQGGQLKAGTPELFLKSGWSDRAASFSPDGRWLAYSSNESGTNEVYVRAFPPPSSGQGGRWQISINGGTSPRWSRSGHDLVYRSGDQIMAAGYIANGDTFVAEKPRVWIAKVGGPGTLWDLSPDGKRVAMVAPAGSADAPKQEHKVVFLQNFFDELRRRVPLQ